MGEEAWSAQNRERARATRVLNGGVRDRIHNRARGRAYVKVAQAHPEEFEKIFAAELEKAKAEGAVVGRSKKRT
jgi:hypothetical protein